jgi:hypothetical protein
MTGIGQKSLEKMGPMGETCPALMYPETEPGVFCGGMTETERKNLFFKSPKTLRSIY